MNALFRLIEDRILAYVSSKVTAMSVASFLTAAVATIQETTGFGVGLDIPLPVYLWIGGFVATGLGWVVRERRPSPSAVEAVGRMRTGSTPGPWPDEGNGGHPNRGVLG